MPRLGFGLGLGLGRGGGGSPRAKTVSATVPLTTGLLTSVSTFGLLAPVAFAKTGGSANLTIAASTGAVSAAAALAAGVSQSLIGTASGADGCVLPFTVTLTGATATPAPTPTPTPGYTFANAEAAALVARMTVAPVDARKAIIDATVGMLKVNASGTNLLTALDILTLGAAHDAQAARLNWIADQFNQTVEGAPVFRADRGYTVRVSGDALSFGVAASGLGQFQQDSASMGVWGRNALVGQSVATIGATAATGSGQVNLSPRNGSNALASRINSSAATAGGAALTSWGLSAVDRSSNTAVQHYKNGATSGGVGTANSAARGTTTLKLGAAANATAPNQYVAAFFGRSLSAAEHAALHAAISYYVAQVGVPELVAATPTWASEAVGLLPDGVAPLTAGKGLNGLGLVRDPRDGTWWVARGTANPSLTQAGIAHLSADFVTVLSDWTLTDLNATDTGGTVADVLAGSCQGIAFDTTDNTLYVVNKATSSGAQLIHVTAGATLTAGSLISVVTLPSASTNGLAYDSTRDLLVVGVTGGNMIWHTKAGVVATGAQAKQLSLTSTEYGDQLSYDAATDTLYNSFDTSPSTDMRCRVYPLSNIDYPLPYLSIDAQLQSNRSIEGLSVFGSKLFTICDGAFHPNDTRSDNHWRRHVIA